MQTPTIPLILTTGWQAYTEIYIYIMFSYIISSSSVNLRQTTSVKIEKIWYVPKTLMPCLLETGNYAPKGITPLIYDKGLKYTLIYFTSTLCLNF